jgi:large conductance mechanosensitive channel
MRHRFAITAPFAPLTHQNTRDQPLMSIIQEFKEFAVKGNVMDLAVGVIIGGAFGKIVDSVVNDLIMPIVGRVTGGLDFSNYYVPLKEVPAGTAASLDAVKKAGVPVFAYGNFITIVLYFLILAWIIFIMVKWINKLRRDVPTPATEADEEAEEVKLLREIRDSLKAR